MAANKLLCRNGHNKITNGLTKYRRCHSCALAAIGRWKKRNSVQVKEHWQVYYQENKERLLAESRKYYSSHKKEKRDRDLNRKFGISQADYLTLFQKQSGKCAICGRDRQTLNRNLAVDHDHQTGKVRQLLCGRCNLGLAFLENRIWNKAAHSYLGVHSNHA